MKRLVAWLCVCGVCLCLLAGCSRDTGDDANLRLPLPGDPTQLDPQMAEDDTSVEVLGLLFEGLTALDDNGVPMPAAADMTVSTDGLTYTFRLRESYWSVQAGTDWAEPTRVTAADFVFAFRRLVDPVTGSPHAALLAGVKGAAAVMAGTASPDTLGVTATDADTLTVTLTAPDPDFAVKLASPACAPCNEAFFYATGGRYGLDKTALLCNGAFYLQAWNHGVSLLCNRNERYHAAADIAPASVRLVIGDEAATAEAITAGTLHAARLSAAGAAAASEAGYTVTGTEDTVLTLSLNPAEPLLSDLRSRTALRDTVEWEVLAAGSDAMTAATGYLPGGCELEPGIPFRTRTNAFHFSVDEQAPALWQEGLAASEVTGTLSLCLLCADDEETVALAKLILQSWQKHLGIYCTLQTASADTVRARVADGRYQMALVTETCRCADAYKALGAAVGRASAEYAARYTALAAALPAMDATERREAVEELESLLWRECTVVPIAFLTRYVATAPGVTGLTVRPFDGGLAGRVYAVSDARVIEE